MGRTLGVGCLPAGTARSNHPRSYDFLTFDAPGHVDTGLHGGNHRSEVTGYFDDWGIAAEVAAFPTGFVLRQGRVHPVVCGMGSRYL
jgi:hypothetical protein